MSRLIVALAALTAGLVWTIRMLAHRPSLPVSRASGSSSRTQDQIWRDAERETISFRIRSGPGLLQDAIVTTMRAGIVCLAGGLRMEIATPHRALGRG